MFARPPRRASAFFLVALTALGLTASSCFLVSDVDRFHPGVGGSGGKAPNETDDPSLPSSLDLTLRGMKPHLNQLIEFRVVDASNFVQCRGILDPIDQPSVDSVTFHMINAVPVENQPYRLDIYGDLNGSGTYDGLPTEGDVLRDHAWRISPLQDFPAGSVSHKKNLVQVVFQHNVQFTDIGQPSSPGADVVLRFPAARMAPFVGHLIEVRIVHTGQPSQTVGVYRNPEIPGNDFYGRIRGMVELGDDYAIDVYIDTNGDSAYDNPIAGPDNGWRFMRTAEKGGGGDGAGGGANDPMVGIDFTFDPSEPSNIDVGAP